MKQIFFNKPKSAKVSVAGSPQHKRPVALPKSHDKVFVVLFFSFFILIYFFVNKKRGDRDLMRLFRFFALDFF